MPPFVDKINRWLIHRYPTIWNTRLLWMVLIAVCIHLLFLIAGLLSLQNPSRFHFYTSDGSLIGNSGVSLFSTMLSVLILVIWIVILLKNNAFKSFYPFSARKLFLSFWYYFIIFIVSTTFYLSYALGYKVIINARYPAAEQLAEIYTANRASIFFNFNQRNYDLSSRAYPAPFDALYCETSLSSIDDSRPVYYTEARKFQFWSLKKVVIPEDSVGSFTNPQGELRQRVLPDGQGIELIFKDEIVALPETPPTTYNYFNYASFPFGRHSVEQQYNPSTLHFTEDQMAMIADWHRILHTNDKAAIEKIVDSFLSIAQKYKIHTNLSKDDWLNIIHKNEGFKVTQFIHQGDRVYLQETPYADTYNEEALSKDADAALVELQTSIADAERAYYLAGQTSYYLDKTALSNTFESIRDIREYGFVTSAYKVHLMLALGLSLFLLMYRTTGLKTLIFSMVTAGVVSIFTIIVLMLFNFNNSADSGQLISAYLVLFIASAVLIVPFFVRKELSKMVRGIHINLVLGSSVWFALLLLLIVDFHFERAYDIKHFGESSNYHSLFDQYATIIYWSCLIFGLLFTRLFCGYIRRWKGSAEG